MLPQINAPFEFLKRWLEKYEIPFKIDFYKTDALKPQQNFIDRNLVNKKFLQLSDNLNLKPIIISQGKYIMDGHHTYKAQQIYGKKNVLCIDLECQKKDALDVLTKIQDRFEYEENFRKKQTEKLNKIRQINKDVEISSIKHKNLPNNSQKADLKFDDFENQIKTPTNSLQHNLDTKTFVCYRQTEINKESKTGNFFLLNPTENYDLEFKIKAKTSEIYKPKNLTNPYYLGIIDDWFNYDEVKNYMENCQNQSKEEIANMMICEKGLEKNYKVIEYPKFIHILSL